jgi:hypothetical protein
MSACAPSALRWLGLALRLSSAATTKPVQIFILSAFRFPDEGTSPGDSPAAIYA